MSSSASNGIQTVSILWTEARPKRMKRPNVDPTALSRQAGEMMRQGRAGEAAKLYTDLARLQPRIPEIQNNLGVALKAAGKLREAVAAYQRAVKLRPDYAVAHRNLSRALDEIGQTAKALPHAAEAFRLGPDDPANRNTLLEMLAGVRFSRPAPSLHTLMVALFERDDIELQRLAPAALSLVLANPRYGKPAAAAGQLDARGGGEKLITDLPPERLLFLLLTRVVIPSTDIESWITLTRTRLLDVASRSKLTSDPAAMTWLAAMAAQCQLTEYAYAVKPEEEEGLGLLVDQLDGSLSPEMLVAALFRPLDQLSLDVSRIHTSKNPVLSLLLARTFEEPEAERKLADAIELLTPIEDETSTRVRAQYEESPYPRWRSLDQPPRMSFRRHLAERFPAAGIVAPTDTSDDSTRILVAGCGTGRHALTTAARYRNSEVTAVDLSRRSLAYAARMSAVFGIENISFAQADILQLGSLEKRFDVIECSGVLHHMATPLAGWRALRGLLAPGGFMRVALYSALARARLDAVSSHLIADQPVEEQIRTRRAEILSLAPDDPARVLCQTADFYALSGCRDALFHESEARFSLPEIAAALEEMELELLGFEGPSDSVRAAYGQINPGDPKMLDLSQWDAFEREHPDSFLAMYQFWCRAG
ncbi:MAG: methyltransferase domain-containing protein [Rhodospirillaceae bacterium]|nr:methyltransferase domain-containing protein [Rhodospirillaceae bacterium]